MAGHAAAVILAAGPGDGSDRAGRRDAGCRGRSLALHGTVSDVTGRAMRIPALGNIQISGMGLGGMAMGRMDMMAIAAMRLYRRWKTDGDQGDETDKPESCPGADHPVTSSGSAAQSLASGAGTVVS